MRRQPVIGLTGGIGSGKSAAADRFAALGIPVVDTDKISHQLTAADGEAMPAIKAVFGNAMVRPDGALNRVAMRQRVFSEPATKLQLEEILHPLIGEHSRQQLAAAARVRDMQSRPPYVLLVVPLLVESGTYRGRVDRLLVVDCPIETQIDRVVNRSGMSRDQVMRIVTTQASRQQRLAVADDVITNDGTLAQLNHQVDELDAAYRANRGIFPTKD